MLTVTVQVKAPPDMAQAVKEALAMWLERYGDAHVVSVVAKAPEQMRIGRERTT
ncbi:hypothetical protein [Dysosmobacter sp.]|jgi:hypothetical protein|uniref:hypothetical protein n=1 Tax=Dysosmobacter sp. TaxID=2591382 RepID=UPI003FD7AB05